MHHAALCVLLFPAFKFCFPEWKWSQTSDRVDIFDVYGSGGYVWWWFHGLTLPTNGHSSKKTAYLTTKIVLLHNKPWPYWPTHFGTFHWPDPLTHQTRVRSGSGSWVQPNTAGYSFFITLRHDLEALACLVFQPLFTVNLHLLSTRDHWRWPSWLNFHICSTARLYSFILSGSLLWNSENYDCFSLVCRVYCHHQHSNNLIIRGMAFTSASTRPLKCAEALPTAPQIDHIFIVNQD